MIGDGLTTGVPGTLSAVSTFFTNTSRYYEVLPKVPEMYLKTK